MCSREGTQPAEPLALGEGLLDDEVAGLAVIAFGAFGLARATVGITTKRWLNLSLRLTTTAWIVLGVLFVALWVYQQGNADFVMNARG